MYKVIKTSDWDDYPELDYHLERLQAEPGLLFILIQAGTVAIGFYPDGSGIHLAVYSDADSSFFKTPKEAYWRNFEKYSPRLPLNYLEE